MSVTITRTAWIDDDGTGTTGTVLNNAVKTSIYNEIDGALAKVAQLAGGNTFTGTQTINGLLIVATLGSHYVQGTGTGAHALIVRNTSAGATNQTQVAVGNDADPNLLSLFAFSSTYAPAADLVPNGGAIRGAGAGGLSITTTAAAPLRFWTNSAERLRITAAGEVCINTLAPGLGQLAVTADTATHIGVLIQNSNAVNQTLTFAGFYNAAGTLIGYIGQASATSVVYSTSSDARLKDDAGRASDLSALRAVVVHDFTWKADGRPDRGVFAQEAHALYPRAVMPGTDETTADGSLARPWATDYSKFVPDLIAGWQQHDAELAELCAALATLKGSPA